MLGNEIMLKRNLNIHLPDILENIKEDNILTSVSVFAQYVHYISAQAT